MRQHEECDKSERPYFADSEIESLLVEAKVEQPLSVSTTGKRVIFGACLFACVVLSVAEQWWVSSHLHNPTYEKLPSGTDVAIALITLVAAIFAYYQWADARREASLEKFYERLKLTNDCYGDWPHARKLVQHFWGPTATGLRAAQADHEEADFERRMYVFLELDNLEYMVVRWQRGFTHPLLMGRAMRTFTSRCRSPEFREIAKQLTKDSGYIAETRRLTNVLAGRAEKFPPGA